MTDALLRLELDKADAMHVARALEHGCEGGAGCGTCHRVAAELALEVVRRRD